MNNMNEISELLKNKFNLLLVNEEEKILYEIYYSYFKGDNSFWYDENSEARDREIETYKQGKTKAKDIDFSKCKIIALSKWSIDDENRDKYHHPAYVVFNKKDIEWAKTTLSNVKYLNQIIDSFIFLDKGTDGLSVVKEFNPETGFLHYDDPSGDYYCYYGNAEDRKVVETYWGLDQHYECVRYRDFSKTSYSLD
jgi:hypothetical protein